MAGWDDISTVAPHQPAASWDSVSSPVVTQMPDMSGVRDTAQKNLQAPKEGEKQENEQFGPKLDRAMGMPVSGALGSKESDITLPPSLRGHLMDAYDKGTAHDAADFMQSAVPAAAHVAAPQDEGYLSKVKEAYLGMNKQWVAAMVYPFVPQEYKQALIDRGLVEPEEAPAKISRSPTGPEVAEAFIKGERETVGKAMGGIYAPVASLLSPVLSPIIEKTPAAAEKVGASPEWAHTIPGGIGVALDFLGIHGAAHVGEMAHPELKELLASKTGKPVESITDNEIADAIRMGFENKAPKAQDFHDTATVILRAEGEKSGAETLRNIYKETGVAPDKVFADAQSNPQIAADIKEGKIPVAYESLIEKSPEAQMADLERQLDSGTLTDEQRTDIKGRMDKLADKAIEEFRNPPAVHAQYTMLAPTDLTLDPKRFQYKEADERGVTGALQGVKKWEPALANPVTAWQAVDGKTYVVNGHQRTDLAQRAEASGQHAVQVPARVYKESEGYTSEFMRVLGAYQNIAEGSGTAIDAAKIMRGDAIPERDRLPELPPKSQLVRQGKGLSALGDDSFGMVVNDIVPPSYAAEVGHEISSPKEQLAAMDVLAKTHPANVEQARLIVQDIKNSGFLHGEQTGLFGEEQFAQSLFAERSRILDNVVKQLRQLKTAFDVAVSQEGALTEAGNVLSREKNIEAKAENEKLIAELQISATRKGEISDALSAAARELKSGKSIATVTKQFLSTTRNIESGAGIKGIQRGAPVGGAEPTKAKTERTLAGSQSIIPGAEKISDKELAERKMKEALQPKKVQEATSEGLFDVGARAQQDIFSSVAAKEISPEHQELEDNLGIPETMNASQLGKLDSKLSGIFGDKEQKGLPKASDLDDEQYKALEDYARRLETARDNIKAQSPSKQIRNIITDEEGALTIPNDVKEFGNDLKRDILNFATPMETGSARAQASAKDFANKLRFSQWNGARITNLLKDRFSPEELKNMWEAMDKASVYAQTLESNGMSRENAMLEAERNSIGHFALPEEQREIIKAMSDWAQHAWDEAKRLGMVEGDGLPFWTPRMAAVVGEDGAWGAPSGKGERPSVNVGSNLRTTSGNLKQRKYFTAEETEAAMKEAFGGEEGEGAKLVRDIRAMPLALTRLESAIAGRSLVNEIKNMGNETGAKTITDTAHEGYFTLDHPALQTYRPQLKINDEGKWEVKKDADGNDLFEKVPIYISNEFEGPLKAVLSQKSSDVYKALMALKGKSMGLIMYSPLIHNAVEYGRALPAMPGKVATFKIYFEGNRVKNDPSQMQEAINAGLVPIGARFFNQDISSVIEEPNLTPGRSWTAKLLGGLVDQVSPKAGNQVKLAIDKMGDTWHNTLLWDRVADLQMGLYANIRDQNIKNGMDPQSAQTTAAHIANRFAGALPMESMGNMARKMANIAMFSRSFTIGNLGVMKDMLKGLPSDAMAQLKRDVGEEGARAASKATQRKAVSAFVLDIGLMYAGNSLLQDALDKLKRDKTLSQIGQGYVDRLSKLLKNHAESPWELLNIPADLQAISSTSTNEPGKETRILFSHDPEKGTAYYMRLPTGKIGEEFEGWLTSPLEMARKKVSPMVSPLIDTYRNADYFGHPIYDKDARGFSGAAESVGKVVKHFMEAQIPEDSIVSAYNLLTGSSGNESLDYMKALGPLGGITFSKGYPGGPEAGILAGASRRHEAEVSVALPKIKKAIELGDEDKAKEIMEKINMTSREQHMIINHYLNPSGKVNSRSLKKFERIATPEEKELMEQQNP